MTFRFRGGLTPSTVAAVQKGHGRDVGDESTCVAERDRRCNIANAVDTNEEPTCASGAREPLGSAFKEIQTLWQLYQEGALSVEEFKGLKANLDQHRLRASTLEEKLEPDAKSGSVDMKAEPPHTLPGSGSTPSPSVLDDVSLLVLVGLVEREMTGAVFRDFVINDATGRLPVRFFFDGGAPEPWLGRYVEVVGRVTMTSRVHVTAAHVRACESGDDVSYHRIAAAHAFLKEKQAAIEARSA